MNRIIIALLVQFLLPAVCFTQKVMFDDGWLFCRGIQPGAELPGYDDSAWRNINLPHDWSIENLPGKESPFDPDAITRMAGGYTTGGTAWYRKSFIVPSDMEGRKMHIYFEGVYMNADVWLNGVHLGNHPYGYTGFWFDITQAVRYGQKNVLAVQVKNEGLNSRWYSGSGIYRHVWLMSLGPVYVEPWGIFITTPLVSDSVAIAEVKTTVTNSSGNDAEIKLITRILDAEGREVSLNEMPVRVDAGSSQELKQRFTIIRPKLWCPETPFIYNAISELMCNGAQSDRSETRFGIRSISFNAVYGLLLNGKPVELRGGCMHHDNGLLGAAAYDRAEERKVSLLKSFGFNAMRCAHNPPSEKFLEACDRLGILVIDEAFDMWQKPKNPDDYHLWFDEWWERDLSSMILRDRNHPSVIMWSLGNEIPERADSSGIEIMKNFRKVISRYDTTRPLTLAVCEFWDHPGRTWDQTAPAFEQVDIGGYNYQWWQYEPDHQKFPDRIIMGTESVPVHAFQNWQMVEKHPYVIGDFVWTAMDYLGEAGIGHTTCKGESANQLMPYPWFNANCGDIDLIGNKKPQSHYRDVVWQRSIVELAVHAPVSEGCTEAVSYWGWPDEQQSWTWPGHEGEILKVNVYSRCNNVRLELNGRLIGEKTISDTSLLTAAFEVKYEPGVLRAVAFSEGKPAGEAKLVTAGKPFSIRLIPDKVLLRSDRNDLSYISVEVVDKKGNVVPDAGITVHFDVKGVGSLAAAGNANPADNSGFRNQWCNTFRGRCLAIAQPSGKEGRMTLRATAPGLKPARITISVKKEL